MSVKVKSAGGAGGSANVVNGIVESYLANSDTIDANTFVEFVGSGNFGLINESATTISESSYSSYNIACTNLSNNKILVAHRYSNSSVYGSVVTINGSNIIVGEEVKICDKVPHYDGVYYGLKLTTIATDTAFMTITCYDDTTIYGLVIKVEGTNIIVGSIAPIITNTNIYYYKVVRLSDNKMVIFHNTSTTGTQNSYLYGTCIEVNNTSFTKGTSYLIKNERTRIFDAVSLSESRTFVMHGDNSGAGKYKRYSIIDISGTTISVSATGDWGNSIISGDGDSLKRMIVLSNNRILVVNGHYDSNDSPNHSIYAEIVTVDNLTFTLNSAKKIISLDKSARSINIIKCSDEEIFLTYSPDSSNDIYYARLSIAGYDVNVYSNDLLISGAYKQTNFAIYGIELVSYSKMFIIYGVSSSNSNLFGNLIGYADIKISRSSNSIKGLTKTIATTTEPGEVWVLNKN